MQSVVTEFLVKVALIIRTVRKHPGVMFHPYHVHKILQTVLLTLIGFVLVDATFPFKDIISSNSYYKTISVNQPAEYFPDGTVLLVYNSIYVQAYDQSLHPDVFRHSSVISSTDKTKLNEPFSLYVRLNATSGIVQWALAYRTIILDRSAVDPKGNIFLMGASSNLVTSSRFYNSINLHNSIRQSNCYKCPSTYLLYKLGMDGRMIWSRSFKHNLKNGARIGFGLSTLKYGEPGVLIADGATLHSKNESSRNFFTPKNVISYFVIRFSASTGSLLPPVKLPSSPKVYPKSFVRLTSLETGNGRACSITTEQKRAENNSHVYLHCFEIDKKSPIVKSKRLTSKPVSMNHYEFLSFNVFPWHKTRLWISSGSSGKSTEAYVAYENFSSESESVSLSHTLVVHRIDAATLLPVRSEQDRNLWSSVSIQIPTIPLGRVNMLDEFKIVQASSAKSVLVVFEVRIALSGNIDVQSDGTMVMNGSVSNYEKQWSQKQPFVWLLEIRSPSQFYLQKVTEDTCGIKLFGKNKYMALVGAVAGPDSSSVTMTLQSYHRPIRSEKYYGYTEFTCKVRLPLN